jgi:hypothetical protein
MDRESVIAMLSRHIYLERWAGSDNDHIRRQLEKDWPSDIVVAAFEKADAAVRMPGRARPGSAPAG